MPTQVARSSRKLVAALLVAPVIFLTGCATNTETGALAGGGIGAVTGAIVGGAFHRPGLGAAIGAGTGAVAGAAIGNAEDKRESRDQARAVAASVEAQQQGLTDVAKMAQQGVPDDIIINKIRTSPVVYNLTADQITWLRQYRVSDTVIREMQTTAMRVPQRVYVEGPVYQPGVVVVEEPPPVAVGVGFGYRRRW
ncbi:MAG TPA: glycine zipper domain-containing protein [Gemmataceae bacterium]|nr:glycine zipper domain-containing protein [Gemmataceae bacterium]